MTEKEFRTGQLVLPLGKLASSPALPIPEKPKAIKMDDGKPRMELLSASALTGIAEVLTFGAKKYHDHNWRAGDGLEYSRLIGAAYRHLGAFSDGEDLDPETGLSHIAHLGCCVMFLLEQVRKGTGTDDRYKAAE